MPPRIPPIGPGRLPQRLALIAVTALAAPVYGQDLPLIRDYPGEGPYECPVFAPPPPADEDELTRAGQLSSDAQQALILGQLQQAEALWANAADVNPASANIAYQHARVLQDLERYDEAIFQYCRSLALGAEDIGIEDARPNLDRIYDIVRDRIPSAARDAFVSGLVQADSSFYEGAQSSFSIAIREAPTWPAPYYNRGVMNDELGRVSASLNDFRRFLELTPSEVDPVVVAVSERIGLLEGVATASTPSPTGALVMGVVPGMGHYYTGRPMGGTLILGLAGSAAAAGIMFKDVTVICIIAPPAGQQCADGDIVAEVVDRPLLTPALGVAAAITVIGAIDALSKARSRRAEVDQIAGEITGSTASGPRLRAPSVTTDGYRIDLNVLRVTFR